MDAEGARAADTVALRHAPAIFMVVALLALALAGCGGGGATAKVLTLATVCPVSGADAATGLAMQQGVDLAVKQNANLGNGYELHVVHVDEGIGHSDQVVAAAAASSSVVGIVGPFYSDTAISILPLIQRDGIVTISPGATLPGLTNASQASAEGLSYDALHPKGTANAFFRLPQPDGPAGKAAADVAYASTGAHGLGARSVFIVDDGSLSGKSLASAFKGAFVARGGAIAGRQTLTIAPQDNTRTIVSSIIEANPDAVFYAGSTASGADLRSLLTLTGASQAPILSVGPIANDSTWSDTVGSSAVAAFTTALLPARDLSTLPGAKDFIAAYQTAFAGEAPTPQSALAYDAAMDEIAAIKAIIKSGKAVTRAAVLAGVASATYHGVTGSIAFNKTGDNSSPIPYSIYSCDSKGAWKYVGGAGGH